MTSMLLGLTGLFWKCPIRTRGLEHEEREEIGTALCSRTSLSGASGLAT